MKKYYFLMLMSILTIGVIYGNGVSGQQENVTLSGEPIKFFAIQHAQSGSISKVNATTNFLELSNVSDTILFSDRPDRIVKTESTQEFLDRWYSAGTDAKNSFFLDPPNAALVIDDQEEQDVVVVELFEPAYDYDSNILVYNFNFLNDTEDKLPSEFGKTTLLIDKIHFGPSPSDG